MSAIPEVMLTPDQATKILGYAESASMYETGEAGLAGVPEEVRMTDAATLVFQARRAWQNGNQSKEVSEILFIAEVDMSPIEQPAESAEPATQSSSNGGSDPSLSEYKDEDLTAALEVLRSYPSSPTIETEIARINAEQQRRASGAQTAQTQAQPPQAPSPAPVSAPGPSTPAASGFGLPPTPDPVLPPVPGHPSSRVESAGGVAEPQGAPPADASDQPGPQAAQPGAEGQPPTAQPPAQDGQRAALEAQITLPMIQAYGLTIESIKALTDEQIQNIVANPGGAQPPATTTVTAPPQQSPPALSPERLALEERVTGPILKAHKRGRVDIPGMSDDELRAMVDNPGGPPAAAPAPQEDPFPPPGSPDPFLTPQSAQAQQATPAQASPSPGQEQVASPPPVPLPPSSVPSEQPAVAGFPPAAPPAPLPPPASVGSDTVPDQSASVPPQPTPSAPGQSGREVAMAIIAKEHLPIPNEIEDPPSFPNDISKVSDSELFSLHARMHSCETRTNWVINGHEDEMKRVEKLLRVERLAARKRIPGPEEGKRRTKDDIEAAIESDPQVQALLAELEGIRDTVATLRVLRDNYKSDVSTCSRQYSMRSGEEKGIPPR